MRRIEPPTQGTQDMEVWWRWARQVCDILNSIASFPDSTAPDLATLKNDFNALLAKVRT